MQDKVFLCSLSIAKRAGLKSRPFFMCARQGASTPEEKQLIEHLVERDNMKKFFDRVGLVSMIDELHKFRTV